MRDQSALFGVLLLGLGLLVCGCSDQGLQKSQSPQELAENLPRGQRLAYFNRAIQNISDESSAVLAVEMFNHYVKSRLFSDLSSGNEAAQKYVISEAQIKKIAAAEAQLRSVLIGASASSLSGRQIDAQQVLNSFNSLSSVTAGNYETRFLSVLAKVRAELPALSIYPDERMTPLESLIASYAYYCGDDGSAQPGSIKILGKRSQLEQFVGTMF